MPAVRIEEGKGEFLIHTSPDAEKLVRLDFNPSGEDRVQAVKTLAAALITVAEGIAKENPRAGRSAALARTHAEEAAMHAVKAATEERDGE